MSRVIKIGGSLYGSEYLVDWLNALSNCNKEKVIIVPGGGPFANQVRQADQRFKLDQALAHNMAVLSMQQFGYVMASLCPKLYLANSQEQIYTCWNQEKVVIWEPYDMVCRYCALEKSWEVSSDSLAAWLAKYLLADHLLYVKSSEKILSKATIEELIKQGCIDICLPKLIKDTNISVQFMHKTQANNFSNYLIDNSE